MSAKEKILFQASKLIHSKGFNNTSVQDILDASSVTKSNFYYHFESKEKLGFDVLEQRLEWFRSFVVAPSLMNTEISPAERIDAFLDRMLELGRLREGELGCPFGNLAQEMSTIHEPLRQALSEFFSLGAAKLAECFEEGKEIGEFRDDLQSKEMGEFVLAQIQGAFLLRKTHRDIEVLERNFDTLRGFVKKWMVA